MKNLKIEYRCPRCRGAKILDYKFHIKCIDCNLEFDKRSIRGLDEENVLALSEKEGIIRVLQEQYNKKVTSEIFHDSYSL